MLSGDGPLVEVLPDGKTIDEVMAEIGHGEREPPYSPRSYTRVHFGSSFKFLQFWISSGRAWLEAGLNKFSCLAI